MTTSRLEQALSMLRACKEQLVDYSDNEHFVGKTDSYTLAEIDTFLGVTATKYYITTRSYAGPRGPGDFHHGEVMISTEPARANLSDQPIIDGWCGTTNDWSVTAHGEYPTLDAAMDAIVVKFGGSHECAIDAFSDEACVYKAKLGKHRATTGADLMHEGWACEVVEDALREDANATPQALAGRLDVAAQKAGHTLAAPDERYDHAGHAELLQGIEELMDTRRKEMGVYSLSAGRAYLAEDCWSDVPVEELFADNGSPKQSYPVYSDVTFNGREYTIQIGRPYRAGAIPGTPDSILEQGADIVCDEGHDDNSNLEEAVEGCNLEWDNVVAKIIEQSGAQARLDAHHTHLKALWSRATKPTSPPPSPGM